MTGDTPALLPCPFCGEDDTAITYQSTGTVCVCCAECGSSTWRYITVCEAAAAWNQRASGDAVSRALTIIRDLGGIGGDHHKQWVLDQVVRALTGTPEAYAAWVARYRDGEDGPDTYEWDEGIAP